MIRGVFASKSKNDMTLIDEHRPWHVRVDPFNTKSLVRYTGDIASHLFYKFVHSTLKVVLHIALVGDTKETTKFIE
ncbi:MAG: hypothetical protein A2Y64_04840 [Candidatus Coatesbacteria bacterium RBG_13_66_14]|uniref:Uncharacterized protein n=1 Tax=Candidatus Coatesbacteria bacterium RBG_13_66_14 TaxID=1817816 RepID=A0A1F5FGU7_9BACT|nr:MAG: hypothetical protein A2Y64_04840 [Candidatus Coatesbacteria bacterium RBG_13_66_14]